ncbi:hypothetical protein FH144_07815 [Staphylococcus caledonicus]|uniref:hypothetical protein n=1 Tax=Staphylococcus TaxID=1279 RepID=UPI001F5A8DE4|nr:hypothetical protein [Staphylococcus sp. acrmy]MCI2948331.1 hypothetical protein [Staphylococcus sp. acrmy]
MSELGIYDIDYIDTMTLREFNYRMYALEYEMLKEEYQTYKLAFAIRDVEAKREVGTGKNKKEEYILSSVNDLIDYQKNIKRLNRGQSIELENSDSKSGKNKPSLDILKQIKNHNKN